VSILAFVLALVIAGPIVKAISVRIARGGHAEPGSNELRRTIQATEQRLAETEARLATVEEKLEFYEKLLANPEKKTVPPGPAHN
jgi:hypothetical protein